MSPVRAFGLKIYPVNSVVHVEVVHIHRTSEGLERREDIRDRDTEQLSLVPIHVEIQLGNVLLHSAGHARELLSLRRVIYKGVGGRLKLLVGAVPARLQSHLDASGRAETRNHGGSARVDLALGIERQRVGHHLHHLGDVPDLPLVPGLQHHGELGVGLARPYSGRGAHDAEHVLDIGLTHEEFHSPVGHQPRALQSGPHRKFKLHREIALILLGKEALGNKPGHQEDPHAHDTERREHALRMPETGAHGTGIEVRAGLIPRSYPAEDEILLLGPAVGRLEESRAHHGAQSQSHYSGYDHRHGDGHAELAEELSGDSGKEAHGYEHGAEHQRHRHQRAAYSAHRLLGRLLRRKMLLLHYAVDILDHDYRVVDDNSYRKHESEQRHGIQREAENQHDTERAHERDRHGYRGNQRGSPALQREEHHEDHEQQSLEQRLVHLVD